MNPTIISRLKEWRNSPLLFVTECIGATPSTQQAEALVKFKDCKRMSIRSGHGTGKDAFASWIALWFETTRTFPKTICLAPTARQLNDYLWGEMSKWLRQSLLADEFVIQRAKIFHKDHSREWWIRAISASTKGEKDQQAAIAGFHGNHALIIVDEASGVRDDIFIPLLGVMTQEDNRILLIGNPTQNKGFFHETQFEPRIAKQWERLHWDSRKSSNVKPQFAIDMAEKYGDDSNVFRVRVIGAPPIDDDFAFIPFSWAEQCVGNEIEVDKEWPKYLGVDVARYGDDSSIILPRQGRKILPWDTFNGLGTVDLAQQIVRSYVDNEASGVGVDAVGVGGGVVDWLQKDPRGLGSRVVVEVNSYSASSDNTKHHRLREELWDKVKENCQFARYSFPDVTVKIAGQDINLGKELANELASVRYFFDGKGAVQLVSKKEMKGLGRKSPNIADALAISEYFSDGYALNVWSKSKKQYRGSYQPGGQYLGVQNRNAWTAL